MDFVAVIEQAKALLQSKGRMTYRTLKRQFALDDEALDDLKFELIEGQEIAVDKDGKMLVWKEAAADQEPATPRTGEAEPRHTSATADSRTERLTDSSRTEGERRQLTVMFIDLVGSTILSQQLDPEEYHARVVAYQTACRQIIARYEGHIAQYLGDGILVYFGYPAAHEDDAVRAVRSGLECVTAVSQLPYTPPLQVRIGVHTGPVVVSEIGAGERTERLALGETPNLAARVQGVAEPNTVFLSPVTQRLVQGLFECQDRGPQPLKSIATPLSLYRVIRESTAQSRFDVAVRTGLTPLVGRESELGSLRQRWMQAKDGAGQVVLLSGEPGIGKSRLVQELKEQVSAEGATRIEFRCSPYYQNSALYPIIDHLQRLLQFTREDTPATKLEKLQDKLSHYRFPQADTVPLLAALLSLPHPAGYPPITISPQKQKEKTQAALVAWLIEEAEMAAVLCAWEDVHWADPSTLEVLTLLLDQAPTTRLLAVLTFRPEFTPLWGNRSHLSQLTLSRLGRTQIEAMVKKVTGENALPPEVVQQIIAKTDGVPLFVEELTKSVIESMGAVESVGSSHLPLQLTIPATLQDSLMARLDRLNTAKEIAQLGATSGREFSYELLHAVSPLDEESLQQGLRQLVEVELLYQRGLPPHATYLFKHALIQDTAYESLLKSRRQQLHQQVAHVLEERFLDTKKTQPELLAHHYTEAGLKEQAIPYWLQAGEQASQRSAYVEAGNTLSRGLEILQSLPDSRERTQQELSLQLQLGATLQAARGAASPEAGKAYTRAYTLCRQLGETQGLFPTLFGLWLFHNTRPDFQRAQELGEQLLQLAQTVQDSGLLLEAHHALWTTAHHRGEWIQAHQHTEQGISLYTSQQHHALTFLYSGHDPGVCCRNIGAIALWTLGYPTQALSRSQEALALAQALAHPFSLAGVLLWTAWLHQYRREEPATQELAEALIAFCTEQDLPHMVVRGTILRGWALAAQGQAEQGTLQMRQGMAAWRTTGAEVFQPFFLALLAEQQGKVGEVEEGLGVLAEALSVADKNSEHFYAAELYRLKGELTLQRGAKAWRLGTSSPSPQAPRLKPRVPSEVVQEAEKRFLKAIGIAQQQQAKSWELRAATSLARLWQQQGKKDEARHMLAEVYNWFTEGFDTKDLQEAKALLATLDR